jgi:hypothetical protein
MSAIGGRINEITSWNENYAIYEHGRYINTEKYTKSLNTELYPCEFYNNEPQYTIYDGSSYPEYTIKEYKMETIKSYEYKDMSDYRSRFESRLTSFQKSLLIGIKINTEVNNIVLYYYGQAISTPKIDDYGVYRFITPIPIFDKWFSINGNSKYTIPEVTVITGVYELPYPFYGLIPTRMYNSDKYIKYKCLSDNDASIFIINK